jgi:hypothetical protein
MFDAEDLTRVAHLLCETLEVQYMLTPQGERAVSLMTQELPVNRLVATLVIELALWQRGYEKLAKEMGDELADTKDTLKAAQASIKAMKQQKDSRYVCFVCKMPISEHVRYTNEDGNVGLSCPLIGGKS